MRAAIYFTPPPQDPLAQAAALWLGRSAFAGATRAPDPAIDPLVSEPARYGFHATLVAPFHLLATRSLPELDEAVAKLAARTAPVDLGRLRIAQLAGFLALRPEREDGAGGLEERLRPAIAPFRAPLSGPEAARRNPAALSARQRENLRRWGYPHVGADYRFHMTLTNRLDDPAPALAALEPRLAPLLTEPRRIDSIAIFVEPAPRAPFVVHSRHPLTGPA